MLNLILRPMLLTALMTALPIQDEPAKPKTGEGAAAAKPAAAKDVHVADLAWMSGRWKTSMADEMGEEHWTDPKNKTLMGMFRTFGSDGPQYQLMTIDESDKGVMY